MPKTLNRVSSALAALALAAAAGADTTATVTADNHYALFTSTSGAFSYHGGNELGSGGTPGSYNWSIAETFTLPAADYLYIAAWSDDQVAQGVLAQLHFDTMGDVLSGDPRWQVMGTNINRGDGDAHPSAVEIAGFVGAADLGGLWEAPFVGGSNGVSPWGTIADISADAQWMWKNVMGDSDPLNGGAGDAEMLIFRIGATSIPTPGAMALFTLGALAMFRRRTHR
jgi:uncharacterized protein (TIGR03382 family)